MDNFRWRFLLAHGVADGIGTSVTVGCINRSSCFGRIDDACSNGPHPAHRIWVHTLDPIARTREVLPWRTAQTRSPALTSD